VNRGNLFLGGAVAFVAIALLVRRGVPRPDDRLPAFAVVTPAGPVLRASDLAGRVVVVNLWASWCAPCREELPKLDSLAARYDTARVVFVALSDDVDGAAAREFLMLGGGLPHLSIGLGLGELKTLFRYPGLPLTVIAGGDGRVVRTWYGYGGPPQLTAIDSIVQVLAPGAGRAHPSAPKPPEASRQD
jgi:thiol-disulfide isomerase/thioredoxin